MNDFFEHLGSDLREIGNQIKAFINKLMGKTTTANGSVISSTVKSNYEINLVPEVKMQMIRAQKMRNLVLFICIVVSSVAVGAVVILFGIKSGQDIVMANQDGRIKSMSDKLNSYNQLDDLITIQGQLSGISNITDRKTVVSRVFGAMGAMLPQGNDNVGLSQLNVNLNNNLVRIEGQADARMDPLIDYRVLESFKKGVALTKYDYGNYVDADGQVIPTQCISETDPEGNAYKTGNSYYAWWDLQIEGCEASQRGGDEVEGAKFVYSSTAEVEKGIPGKEPVMETVCDENGENCHEEEVKPEEQEQPEDGENTECVEGEDCETTLPEDNKIVPLRVKVWRTPQFNQWLSSGRMSTNGAISNIEHFDSKCYKYNGTTVNGETRWVSENNCMLAPDGFTVTSSSNARDESNNLVLKFDGTMTFAKDFFSFNHKHMIAIGPMGQNVTDSYIQVGNMFTKEATECEPDDEECLNNKNNSGEN